MIKTFCQKENIPLFLIVLIYLLYFHFFLHDINRNIFSFPEQEILFIYHSMLINDGYIESFDHPGYSFFLFFAFLLSTFKLINIIEIGSLTDLLNYDLFSDEFFSVFKFLRILSFFINFLFFYLLFKLLDTLDFPKLSNYTLVLSLLFLPNINFLSLGSITSIFACTLLLISLNILLSNYKFKIFFSTLFLLLAISSKVQILIFAPILFVYIFFLDKKPNSFIETMSFKSNFYLNISVIIYLFFSSIVFFILHSKNLFSLNHVFIFTFSVIFFFISYIYLNKKVFSFNFFQINLALLFFLLFLMYKFHPNNFLVIFDPFNAGKGYIQDSSDKNFFLKLSDFTNLHNFFFSKFYYIYFLLLFFLINKKSIIYFIFLASLIYLSLGVNNYIKPLNKDFWYLVYSDILVIVSISFLYSNFFKNGTILKLHFNKFQNIFLISILFFHIFNFSINDKISNIYGFNDEVIYNDEDIIQFCSREPYINRLQPKYDILKLKKYIEVDYITLKDDIKYYFFNKFC